MAFLTLYLGPRAAAEREADRDRRALATGAGSGVASAAPVVAAPGPRDAPGTSDTPGPRDAPGGRGATPGAGANAAAPPAAAPTPVPGEPSPDRAEPAPAAAATGTPDRAEPAPGAPAAAATGTPAAAAPPATAPPAGATARAPGPRAAPAIASGDRLPIPEPALVSGLFTASAALGRGQLAQIARAARPLIADPSLRATVRGHTDRRGSDGENAPLSEQRAAAVASALTAAGVAAERLDVVGAGSTDPLDLSDTITGHARNRRVEIIFHRDAQRAQPRAGGPAGPVAAPPH
jgi:outer membrane protein OmpA-like peptidoglycan-associated protein